MFFFLLFSFCDAERCIRMLTLASIQMEEEKNRQKNKCTGKQIWAKQTGDMQGICLRRRLIRIGGGVKSVLERNGGKKKKDLSV